ncbi:hypothetical protein [Mesorhizobium sp.]|uniref:hypothetical protein n=1 Tax=Mesorhizobium sp. TaxID=1871066 RepID=UPI0025FABD13|nr:hypothetical protein [Mesorhizobium sp.]
MKKRYAEWLKLTAAAEPDRALPLVPTRVLDLPGFDTIERKLLLYTTARSELPPALEVEVNDLSKKTFGITMSDTMFAFPAHYNALHEASQERWDIDDEFYEHEEKYETSEATDDEVVAILADLGLDFNDSRGFPLRCTKLFSRQAEAAAKGLLGKMPDRAAADLEVWGNALEEAARLHMNKKR